MRQVAIVHFNTPELTEAAILSLWKHGGEDCQVTIFDNSDSRPFKKKMRNVRVIDNTKGQVFDFEKELAKFPDKEPRMGCAAGCEWGSAKHIMSVQKLWDIIDEGFLLMDSDIIIKANVDHMFNYDECAVGHIQSWDLANNPGHIDRLVPMLLWINVPMCKAGGARFYDPERCFALQPGGSENPKNWYDTGASFLEDIRTLKPQCHGLAIDIRPLMQHYGSGSWRRNEGMAQMRWLNMFAQHWKPSPEYRLGVPDKRSDYNRNAKIYICTHKDYTIPLANSVYEVVDMREGGDEYEGMHGSFYSELLAMKRIADKRKLPTYVGFCHYRKYFEWMDVVPEISRMIRARDCAVSLALNLGDYSMREHYSYVGNVEDLDIVTGIIDKHYPKFSEAWRNALKSHRMYPYSMFVMRSKDFRTMFKMIWGIVERYREQVGNVEERILSNKGAYHIPKSTFQYQYRIGGQICERLVSAYIADKFPNAEEVRVVVRPQ